MKLEVLERLARQAAEMSGLDLYHAEWTGGRSGILRVFIEGPAGVTIRDCENVSRDLSVLLDVEDPIPGRYTLEVSSPGLDRRLFTPAHYAANIGAEVEVKTKTARDGRKKFVGKLAEADDSGFLLEEAQAKARFPYSEVEAVRLIVKF